MNSDQDQGLFIDPSSLGVLRAPFLASPKDGVVITTTNQVTLRWLPVTGAKSYVAAVAQDSNFVLTVFTAVVDTNSVRTTPLASGRFYWHIRARNVFGADGLWSEVRVFYLGGRMGLQ